MSCNNHTGICAKCSRVIENYHDYEHCDHVFFDGEIGCDNCLNIVSVENSDITICWGCHCRLPSTLTESECDSYYSTESSSDM